jgi:uncharacterized delta-60 repeat protein
VIASAAMAATAPAALAGPAGAFRFLPDGTADPMFGANGFVSTERSDIAQADFAGAPQADGSLVTAALGVDNPAASRDEFIVRRFLPSGAPDPAFGSAGVVVTRFDDGNMDVDALVVQPDGRVLVIGDGTFEGQIVVRYLPNGQLDPSYGSGGIATSPAPGTLEHATLDGFGRLLTTRSPTPTTPPNSASPPAQPPPTASRSTASTTRTAPPKPATTRSRSRSRLADR